MMMNMALRGMIRSPLIAIGGVIMAINLVLNYQLVLLIAIPIIAISYSIYTKKIIPTIY